MAQRAGVRVNMADVVKVDFDWTHNDAEFHGLDQRAGSGIDLEQWQLQVGLAVDDFIPLLGFRLPVNVSRLQKVERPKYEINSDVEIIDEDVRNVLSAVDTQERFTSRISHAPSKAALLRYLVDPWSLQLSGSRNRKDGPLEVSRGKTLQGSLNYDLRITGNYKLGAYPLLKYIPVFKGLSLVPQKFAFGASFNNRYTMVRTITPSGAILPRPVVRTRPGKLTASVDYKPLPVADLTVTAASDRDLLREEYWHGINVGQESRRSYDLRMTFHLPKGEILPSGRIWQPVRAAVRELNKLRPTVQFSGNFFDQHDPAQRQEGDPIDVRSLSNNGSWDVRFEVPIGTPVSALFPEHKYSQSERQQLVEQQKLREAQQQRGGGRPTPSSDMPPPDAEAPPAGEEPVVGAAGELTPEEIRRREEERLLAAAQERLEEEREQGLAPPEPEPEAVASDGRLDPLVFFKPLLNALRNTNPVKVTFSTRNRSTYARLRDSAAFWYQTGLSTRLDVPDSLYATTSHDQQNSLSLATNSKLARSISLDVKYTESHSTKEQINSESETLRQDWPDASISLSGVEKWPIFGGKRDQTDAGWFRSSNLNFSYKRSKSVNGYTPTSFNPTFKTNVGPRWSMTFHSGLAATLTANLVREHALANGVTTNSSNVRYGLQLRHQFRAEGFLAKLGLYRPGSSQTLNMDIDLSYQSDRKERLNPGGLPTTPTGMKRISVNPSFSYQISRNLSGAVRFIFSRNRNIASDQTTTKLGLGVEATFVF